MKPKEFAKKIGVSVKTLQRWDNEGILKAYRTPTNRRYYTEEQYKNYTNKESSKTWIINGYAGYSKIEQSERNTETGENYNFHYKWKLDKSITKAEVCAIIKERYKNERILIFEVIEEEK